METSPLQETPKQSLQEKQLEALHGVAEKFELKILRDEMFNNTHAFVVEDGYGGEVHIGFPDRMDRMAATGKIRGIPMYPYGHGAWQRGIDLSK